MTESMPPVEEESRRLNRSLTEKVLDRAARDPQWKQQLLDEPEAAMRMANFPEVQQLEEMRQSAAASKEEGEVRGHQRYYCPQLCYVHSMYWRQADWSITAPTSGVFQQ
jgi:hypothetical protein